MVHAFGRLYIAFGMRAALLSIRPRMKTANSKCLDGLESRCLRTVRYVVDSRADAPLLVSKGLAL